MKIAISIQLLTTLFSAAGYVSAHGFLSSVTINGETYTGNNPYGKTDPTIIRRVRDPYPNVGASNPALTCGPNATAASQVADANPGDTMTFNWRGADNSRWPHNTGPMLTYMASCGDTSCDQFDASKAKWFKIRQVGRKDGSAQWVQHDLYDEGVDTVQIPKNLAPGNYIIRHEIIALHLATQHGGAEFYPGCTQLRIGGSQTGAPKDSELVSIPGAYSDDDPGIYDPDVYNPKVQYVFPGPPVAAFVGVSPTTATSTSTKGGSGSGSSTTTTQGAPTSTTTPKSSGRVCRLKKRPVSSLEQVTLNQRRHFRRLVFPWSH